MPKLCFRWHTLSVNASMAVGAQHNQIVESCFTPLREFINVMNLHPRSRTDCASMSCQLKKELFKFCGNVPARIPKPSNFVIEVFGVVKLTTIKI